MTAYDLGMDLVNEFTVNADVATTWATLTDIERIAPCMPGAQLTEIEGDTYRGTVAVKVGPITAKFKGEAHFVEQDVEARKAVLKAAGRDTGGKGNASALITAQLTPVTDTSTHVQVSTDLTITGKVAQFGRGALADVSTKLIGQFVEQLETTVLNGTPAGAAADAGAEPAAAAEEQPAPKPRAKKAAPKPSSKAAAAADAVEPAAVVADAAAAEPAGVEPTAAGPTGTAPAGSSGAAAPAGAGGSAGPSPSSAEDAPGADAGDGGDVDTAAIVELAERATDHPAPEQPAVRKIDSPEAQPIDLIDTAGGAMLKRLLPLGLVAILVYLLLRRRGRSD